LVITAIDELQSAVDELNDVMLHLQDGNGQKKSE
jgi:hypothetical protein